MSKVWFLSMEFYGMWQLLATCAGYTSTPADLPDPPFRFFEGLVPRLLICYLSWHTAGFVTI